MLKIPKLPAAWLGMLTTLATLAAILQPHLSGTGRTVVDLVLAVLAVVGIVPVNQAIKAHGEASAAIARRQAGR